LSTSFGIKVAEFTGEKAEASASETASEGAVIQSGSGAAPTNFAAVAGSAVGVLGVVVGAVLL
jgi:hypothetical protein